MLEQLQINWKLISKFQPKTKSDKNWFSTSDGVYEFEKFPVDVTIKHQIIKTTWLSVRAKLVFPLIAFLCVRRKCFLFDVIN